MKALSLAAILTTLLLGTACTEAVPSRPPASATILQASAPSSCALGVPGARVVYEATPAGAALVFTATPDRVEDLRERARNVSAMHGPGQRVGAGHEGRHGTGGAHGIKAMQMPPAYAGEEDIDGGARVSFTPADAHDVDVLRAKLETRAQEMMRDCR